MTDDVSDQHPEPVVIAMYSSLGEAEVTRANLASHGIEAFIIDELEGGTLPVEGESGVSVLVRDRDAELARAALGAPGGPTDSEPEEG